MKKKYLFLIQMILIALTINTQAQNVECVGNSIKIPLIGYKDGIIQWQFSTNGADWQDLSGYTSQELNLIVTETGYFRANVKYGNCSYYSEITLINVYPEPTSANAGNDTTIYTESTNVTLEANSPVSGTGQWSIISGGNGSFSDINNPASSFTGTQCTDYILRWTISTACKSSTDDVTVGFHAIPTVASAGPDTTINTASTIVILKANNPLSGTGQWSIISGGNGSFSDINNPASSFTGTQCTDYVLVWTISTACNSSADNVNIGFHAVPTVASAGTDQSIYSGSTTTTLSGNSPIVGSGSWTVMQGINGAFTNPSVANTSFTGLYDTKYVLRWTISTACNSTTDDVKIDIYNPSNIVLDISGNIYPIVTIGSQVWMAENLRTIKFDDGTGIPSVTNQDVWLDLTTPAYCWYNNDSVSYKSSYGALYNGYAVYTGKICPTGWRVPSNADWTTLETYLGGSSLAGGKLKETGTSHWISPNTGASNVTGFTALPGGYSGGGFYNLSLWGYWWSYPAGGIGSATPRVMNYMDRGLSNAIDNKYIGFSVRCLKN